MHLRNLLGFSLSLLIVAMGQPARWGWVGGVTGILGFAIFFVSLSDSLSKRNRFWLASLWFALVQLIQLSWMSSMEFQGSYILFVYGLLCVGLGSQFGLLTLFIPASGSIRTLNLLAAASFWTLMEWLRLFVLCGFSWTPVGLALSHSTYSLQFISIFGIFGLSFWVMLTNLSGLKAWRERKLRNVALWLLLAAVPYLFGAAHLAYHLPKSERHQEKIQTALIQTDLLPSEKMRYPGRTHEYVSPVAQWNWVVRELKEKISTPLDMIVLPEAAVAHSADKALYPFETVRDVLTSAFGVEVRDHFPAFAFPYAEEKNIRGNKKLYVSNLFWCQTIANYFKTDVVVGLDHTDRLSQKNYNSAFYLQSQGAAVLRYDKRALLPFAEYLPFRFLSFLSENYGIVEFFTPGIDTKVFLSKKSFCPSICYEETFPSLMREGKMRGADMFINVTNDNYFPDSHLHAQHLSHAKLRAVENGIPLIRSCNSGVSAAIDSFGRVLAKMAEDCKGVLSCSVSTYTFSTLYSFWGDSCIVGCSLVFLALFWARNKKYFLNSLRA